MLNASLWMVINLKSVDENLKWQPFVIFQSCYQKWNLAGFIYNLWPSFLWIQDALMRLSITRMTFIPNTLTRFLNFLHFLAMAWKLDSSLLLGLCVHAFFLVSILLLFRCIPIPYAKVLITLWDNVPHGTNLTTGCRTKFSHGRFQSWSFASS